MMFMAWVGMGLFFVFGIAFALTPSQDITNAMLVSLTVWMGAGIWVIRKRRRRY